MNIKSYTDMLQSRKLAEILPIESADMYYEKRCNLPEVIVGNYSLHMQCRATDKDYKKLTYPVLSPCWSLTALLEVIPQEIFNGEYIINVTEGCDNRWVLTYDHFENRNHSYYSLSIGADNLVDACVAMIESLHELNLL